MVTRFRLEFQRSGQYKTAYVCAMQEVGRALVITSLSLVLGLSALLFSVMSAQIWFGLLLSAAIVLALLMDIFVMPVLIIWLQPFGPEWSCEQKGAEQRSIVNGELAAIKDVFGKEVGGNDA